MTDSEDAQLQPGQLNLLRSNIVQKLEQSAWAALHHSQQLYQQSLQAARALLAKNFLFDNQQTTDIVNGIDQLLQVNVDTSVPDLQDTLQAVKQALAQAGSPVPAASSSASSTPVPQPKSNPAKPSQQGNAAVSGSSAPSASSSKSPVTLPQIKQKPATTSSQENSTSNKAQQRKIVPPSTVSPYKSAAKRSPRLNPNLSIML